MPVQRGVIASAEGRYCQCRKSHLRTKKARLRLTFLSYFYSRMLNKTLENVIVEDDNFFWTYESMRLLFKVSLLFDINFSSVNFT